MARRAGAASAAPGPEGDQELLRLAGELNLAALQEEGALARLLAEAEKEGWSYTDFALRLLRTETTQRGAKRVSRALRRSGLGPEVTLQGFDYTIRPGLSARTLNELLLCRFVAEKRGLVCVGPPGLGKTRVCRAIGHAACRLGYSVVYKNTAVVLEELAASQVDGTYRRALRRFTKPALLIMDEFGYMGFDRNAARHLFRLVSERYERGSTIVAANTGFKRWKTFFPSEAECVATVDRLVDRATILRFTGKPVRQPKDTFGASLDDES